jgi:hypothetical protein
MEGASPRPIEPRQQDHEETVAVAKGGALGRAARHDQLLTQHRVLGDELALRADGVLDDARHDRRRRGPEEPLEEAAGSAQATNEGGLGNGDDLSQHALLPGLVVDGKSSMATVDDMRHPAPRTDRLPTVGTQPRETKGRMAKVATTLSLLPPPTKVERRTAKEK